jgi:hypothetical protein
MKNFARSHSNIQRSTTAAVLCAALFACAGVIASQAPWITKPFDQWTSKDLTEVLQASPWSRTNITIADASHRVDMAPATDQSSLASAGDETVSTLSAPPDYILNSALGANSTSYNVYWLSSRTIRAALARAEVLGGKMTPDAAEAEVARQNDEYQVLVTGPRLRVLHGRSPAELRNVVYLQAGNKGAKTSPTHISFLHGSSGAIFYFPKTNADGSPTIPGGVTNLEFRLLIERAMLYASFNPQKMVDRGGADL